MHHMTTDYLRELYLQFFERKGHARLPSARLVPENDQTTLFTGSGMQPLLPYLLGKPHPAGSRIVNSQKCFRADDIEEVGDNRHTTFFEMLGNWSFGAYFKDQQLSWLFEFLTKGVGLAPKKLYVTVFAGDTATGIPRDTESVEIWKKLFADTNPKIIAKDIELLTPEQGSAAGMRDGRIFYYDSSKNWWSRSGIPKTMPSGEPGGPDSEVFYDFGTTHSSKFGKHCHPNCDCGRFMEIGNSVFMEFIKQTDGSFASLPQKNVDFGGGLERITAAANDTPDIFRIDAFKVILDTFESTYGLQYQTADAASRRALRIIADHIRAAVFMIGDGVIPSKKEQGYVLRRLLRRAVYNSNALIRGYENVYPLVDTVIDYYGDIYSNLKETRQRIHDVFEEEEAKFDTTLRRGLKELGNMNSHYVTGVRGSTMASTFGFPVEMTKELAKEYGKQLSEKFDEEFAEDQRKHKAISHKDFEGKFKGGLADHSEMSIKYHTATHLLHAALREVLGKHVFQKGSNITPERLRFDFSYPQRLTVEQLQTIEELVNQKIRENLSVSHQTMTVKEAKHRGALGLFEHKYGEKVSVYTIGNFSLEICGGPHVERTGSLGQFRIVKEESTSAGIRRIKATLR